MGGVFILQIDMMKGDVHERTQTELSLYSESFHPGKEFALDPGDSRYLLRGSHTVNEMT